ncbi:MAG: DNA polymerase/3'-5' exonuclease PolX [Acidobacteria bacterium]|nr:MAG: DNA polymerase/3'-5' exonuclease PolX [Acidobacteriota bacterium]
MRNLEIAAVFNQIADLLEIQGANPFRVRAYRRGAASLESLTDNIEAIVQQGAVRNISGIGDDLEKKIVEYLQSGRMEFHEQLKHEVPLGLVKMVEIPSVGPKTAKQIYDQFRIQTIEELEALCRTDSLLGVPGFKKKTIENILRGIELYRRRRGNYLLGKAVPIATQICRYLEPHAERVSYAGSLRRMKEVVHDIDILAASTSPEQTMKAFLGMPLIDSVLAQGGTKASLRVQDDLQVDLRVIEPRSWGAAMHYFTGSKAHNIRMRERAIKLGLKLNEYGLFDGTDQYIAGADEKDIFEKLGLPFIPPVLREDQGEMEAAAAGKLPNIVELPDIQGDLHMHTTWSDGKYSTEEMIEAARKRGYKYVAITDHSKSLGVAGGLSDDDLMKHMEEIRSIGSKYADIRVLAGTEVDIRLDGTLDYSDELLGKLDFVVASVHSGFKQSRSELTARVVRAMQSPYVRVIGHPTGRLLGDRDPYEIDFEEVMKEAARTRTCLEVNSNFHRLDLNDVHCRKARDMGVHVIISTDSHNYDDLLNLPYGVATAQRGWIEKDHSKAKINEEGEEILKLDESCISNPKSEISDWTGRPWKDRRPIGDFGFRI